MNFYEFPILNWVTSFQVFVREAFQALWHRPASILRSPEPLDVAFVAARRRLVSRFSVAIHGKDGSEEVGRMNFVDGDVHVGMRSRRRVSLRLDNLSLIFTFKVVTLLFIIMGYRRVMGLIDPHQELLRTEVFCDTDDTLRRLGSFIVLPSHAGGHRVVRPDQLSFDILQKWRPIEKVTFVGALESLSCCF